MCPKARKLFYFAEYYFNMVFSDVPEKVKFRVFNFDILKYFFGDDLRDLNKETPWHDVRVKGWVPGLFPGES